MNKSENSPKNLIQKTFLLPFLITLASFSCITPNPPPHIPLDSDEINLQHQAVAGKLTRPYLWLASKNDQSCYLFGTVHWGINANADVPLLVWRKLRNSKVFVTTTPNILPSLPGKRIRFEVELAQLQNKNAPPLNELLSNTAWEKLLGRLDMAPDIVANLKPRVAASLYISDTLVSNLHIPRQILDFDAAHIAQRSKLRFVHLDAGNDESLLQTLPVFDTGPMNVSELEKLVLSDEIVTIRRERMRLYSILAAYRRGETDKNDLPVIDMKLSKNGYERSIGSRNRSWLPELERQIHTGSCFVAVGIAHFTGSESLINLLRGRGFNVSRISMSTI